MLSPDTFVCLVFFFAFFCFEDKVTKTGKEAKVWLKRKKEIGGTGLVENEQYESSKE